MSYQSFEDPSFKLYLKEIVQEPLLTVEEEVELAEKIERGDEAARLQMIRANLRLVVKIAQEYAHYGLPLTDLISEGNVGLMKAVERFNPEKGGKMSTYAAWWIKQSIKRALANQSKVVRLPVHVVDKGAKLRRIIRQMTEELKREPTDQEISEEIGIPVENIVELRSHGQSPISFDAPLGEGEEGDRNYGEILADPNAFSADILLGNLDITEKIREIIQQNQAGLTEREHTILKERFGLEGQKPKTLEEVGRIFGVTRERIRQLEAKGLGKLRIILAKESQIDTEPDSRPQNGSPIWESKENHNGGGKRRKRKLSAEFSEKIEVTEAVFNSLDKTEKYILEVWYYPGCERLSTEEIVKKINQGFKYPLDENVIYKKREQGILHLYKALYKKTLGRENSLVQGKMIEGVREYLRSKYSKPLEK